MTYGKEVPWWEDGLLWEDTDAGDALKLDGLQKSGILTGVGEKRAFHEGRATE